MNISNRGKGNYIDFKNAEQMKQVNALKEHSGFFDYAASGMGIISLFHHVQYNGTKQHGWIPVNNEKK